MHVGLLSGQVFSLWLAGSHEGGGICTGLRSRDSSGGFAKCGEGRYVGIGNRCLRPYGGINVLQACWQTCMIFSGLPPYQVASWSIQPFGHNRYGPKVGETGCVPLGRGSWVPCNTMWPGPRPASVPSCILIHPTVWPQYINVTDSTDRQDRQTVYTNVCFANHYLSSFLENFKLISVVFGKFSLVFGIYHRRINSIKCDSAQRAYEYNNM